MIVNEDEEQHWVSIRRATFRQVAEWSLVLTAMQIEHRVHNDAESPAVATAANPGPEWHLLVRAEKVRSAEAQLYAYQVENVQQVVPTPPPAIDSGWVGVAGYLAIIWTLPLLIQERALGQNWYSQGVNHAASVQAGEWWRTITALTLHGDIAHIVGNSVFGAVFGLMLGRHLGSGIGWLLVVLAGASGNAINAWIQPDDFRSLGASTATFAALGLLGVWNWRQGYYADRSWRRSVAPLFAAFALLAFTGVGSENTDVAGHFLGFGCGILFGLAATRLNLQWLAHSGQHIAGAAAVGLVVGAWLFASS